MTTTVAGRIVVGDLVSKGFQSVLRIATPAILMRKLGV